ncbi:MAG: hypothetical protein GX851_01525, partial [Clostridiales bacterium]|nr:hypothetical protein [Clostridiales bacterium]
NVFSRFYLHRFELEDPEDIRSFDEDMLDDLKETNDTVTVFFNGYISFLRALVAVEKVFKPFIKDYLNRGKTFPDSGELAVCFDEFNKQRSNAFKNINCRMKSFSYKVLKDEKDKPILCEEMNFSDLQSFLFYDFFNGVGKNFLPNDCKQCGKFFLIRGGKYFSYCDRPVKGEPGKTCRDIGARRQYDDKCKNDPVWQTYNRAYKAHYARYMKKKMTVAEFEEWSRFASELRDKALSGTVSFEQYYADIRK